MNLTCLSLYLLINLVLGLPFDAVEPPQRGRGMARAWGRAARKGRAWIDTDQTLADAPSSIDFPTEIDTSLPEDTIHVQYSHEILPEPIDDQINQSPEIGPLKTDQDHAKSQTDKYDKTAQYDSLKSTPATPVQEISNPVIIPETKDDNDATVQHSSAKEFMKDFDQHDLQQDKGNKTNVSSADSQKESQESSPSQPENINKSVKENSNSTPAQPQTPGKNDKSKDSPNSSLPSSNVESTNSTQSDTIWVIVGSLFGVLAFIIGAATYNHFRKERQGNQRPESSSSYNSDDADSLVFPPVPVDKSQIYYNRPLTHLPEITISGPDSESHDYDVVISNN